MNQEAISLLCHSYLLSPALRVPFKLSACSALAPPAARFRVLFSQLGTSLTSTSKFKQLPKLDTMAPGLQTWLQPHLCSMFSKREVLLRKGNSDTICNLKNVVHAILSPKHGILRLKSTESNSFPILFFLRALHLDLNSHSVVREVYAMVTETSHLVSSAGLIATQITLTENDMSLWKRGLFALSERCRDWVHAATCEYLSCDDTEGFCPCGKGQIDFGSLGNSSLESFAPHVRRVAISTLFRAPYLDSTQESSESGRKLRTERFKQFEPVTDGGGSKAEMQSLCERMYDILRQM